MKKLALLLIVGAVALFAVSCGEKASDNIENVDKDIQASENGTSEDKNDASTDDQQQSSADGKEPTVDNTPKKPGNTLGLTEISYETFKEVIGYSMFPYDTPVSVERNMLYSVTGFNGDVELTYFAFISGKDAADYYEEIIPMYPGEVESTMSDGDYSLCNIKEEGYCYTLVRLGKTIICSGSKNGYDSINNWLYGLGYMVKE